MGEERSLTLAEARRLIDLDTRAIEGRQRVALKDALDRVLAEDLIARCPVPAHDNAAMDGYALHARTSGEESPRSLRVIGTARAGHPFVGSVATGECVRIMTGAVMPDGCDAVVPQENVAVEGDRVAIDAAPRPGQHRRLAGEDLRAGDVVLGRGRRITPADLGLAASVGEAMLDVVRRPRVAVFSTGNELRDVGQALDAGTIRDSNRYTLIGMLLRLGAEVIDLGIVRDDPAALEAALIHACGATVAADAIVTSGGVSAGDADHTRDVMRRLGSVAFWKLAIKPGRPLAFGHIAAAGRPVALFGLPGNPVAVMVVFYALVRDALLKSMGARPEPLPSLVAQCDIAIPKVPGRTEFVRAVATRRGETWHVRPTGAQGSGILRSMSEANCLIVLEHERGPVEAGGIVAAWPFHGLV